jgi:hypothetical protein
MPVGCGKRTGEIDLTGIFPVTREMDHLRIIELDCVMCRNAGARDTFASDLIRASDTVGSRNNSSVGFSTQTKPVRLPRRATPLG